MAFKYKGDMPHLNGNKICVIDVETTGLEAGYHEICQICVLPVTESFKIDESVEPFCMMIKPEFPARWQSEAARINGLRERSAEHGMDRDLVYSLFVDWFFNTLGIEQTLSPPFTKQIMPLAKNWAFDKGFLNAWMGKDEKGEKNIDYFIHRYSRDLQPVSLFLNDLSYMNGDEAYPFTRHSLSQICLKLNVDQPNAHDALGDCVATLECYKRCLQLYLPNGVDLNTKHQSWDNTSSYVPLRDVDNPEAECAKIDALEDLLGEKKAED